MIRTILKKRHRVPREKPQGTRTMRCSGYMKVTIPLLLVVLQPAYANGGHVHIEGVFFLLLGGIIFVGGLGMVLYLLFRTATPEEPEAPEEHEVEC